MTAQLASVDRACLFGEPPHRRSRTLVEMLSTRPRAGVADQSARTTGNCMTIGTPRRRDQALYPIDAQPQPERCSSISEQPAFVFAIERMTGLDTAATLLGGKPKLADALGCSLRNVHHKVAAGRGISNFDLTLAATALEQRAAKLLSHAEKLRAEAAEWPA